MSHISRRAKKRMRKRIHFGYVKKHLMAPHYCLVMRYHALRLGRAGLGIIVMNIHVTGKDETWGWIVIKELLCSSQISILCIHETYDICPTNGRTLNPRVCAHLWLCVHVDVSHYYNSYSKSLSVLSSFFIVDQDVKVKRHETELTCSFLT